MVYSLFEACIWLESRNEVSYLIERRRRKRRRGHGPHQEPQIAEQTRDEARGLARDHRLDVAHLRQLIVLGGGELRVRVERDAVVGLMAVVFQQAIEQTASQRIVGVVFG